jgi:hypothetical protein
MHYISNPSVKALCNGQILQQLLVRIVEPLTFWDAFFDCYVKGALNPESIHALVWLTLEILYLPVEFNVDITSDAHSISEDLQLINSDSHDIRKLAYKVKHILQTKSFSAVTDFYDMPGGRHDNDFQDFRQIAIYPTADELLSSDSPFYRRAAEVMDSEPDQRIAMHLDNQFRLLREDMLAELREDLQVVLGQKRGRRFSTILRQLFLVGFGFGEEKRWKQCTIKVHCKHGLEQLSNLTSQAKKSFLTNNPTFLKHQSFGCLLQNKVVIAFATLERVIDDLLMENPIINLKICGDTALKKALLAFQSNVTIDFLQVDTPFFAYEPILRGLQSRIDLPLTQHLLEFNYDDTQLGDVVLKPQVLNRVKEQGPNDLQRLLSLKSQVKLDHPQMESLVTGASQPVNLIQGPPGMLRRWYPKSLRAHITQVQENLS